MQFRTHTGEIITGSRLDAALNAVADNWAALGQAMRTEDGVYAAHVSETEKDQELSGMLAQAEAIRQGNVDNFAIWQRINTKITGECVALLPK